MLLAGALGLALLALVGWTQDLSPHPPFPVREGGQGVRSAAPRVEPSARYGHTMVTIGDSVYLFGGMATAGSSPSAHSPRPMGAVNGLWRWDANNWQQITPANTPPPARYDHAATVLGNKLYVFFGYAGAGMVRNDIWVYDPVANTWTQLPSGGTMPVARANHSVVAIGNYAYLFGGNTVSGPSDNFVYRYDPATGNWEQKAELPGQTTSRYDLAAANVNDRLVIFGGYAFSSGYRDDLWEYDPSTNEWSQLPLTNGPPASASQAVAAQGNTMWLLGGTSHAIAELDTVFQFTLSPTQTQGSFLSSLLATRTHAQAVALPQAGSRASTSGTQIVIFGGTRKGQALAETYIYSLGSEIYLPLILR